MPLAIPKAKTRRRQVKFPFKMQQQSSDYRPPTALLSEILSSRPAVNPETEEIVDEEFGETYDPNMSIPGVPTTFLHPPVIQDNLETESSKLEFATIQECLPGLTHVDPALANSYGVPKLLREDHVDFLEEALKTYPPPFVAMDASRPWILYWSLAGLTILGQDVSKYRNRAASTIKTFQNESGGFAGGHGQLSHMATSYGATLALALVGDPKAYDIIDRKAVWHWLGQMKQPDGGFRMAFDAEEDIRGAYCAMVIISLLNLPLDLPPDSPARTKGDETFLTQLPEWIGRCQSFDGGIAAAPWNEAHGAYAFCALACLSIVGNPQETLPKYLNLPSLISWITSQQRTPEGGFAGRTNKLVDGCYSHWVGTCFVFIEAALQGTSQAGSVDVSAVWSREGLIRYILGCCQHEGGGLRDKPSKRPDAYHSCYCLAGLSAAQHKHKLDESRISGRFGSAVASPFGWYVDTSFDLQAAAGKICGRGDMVNPVHPVFVIPQESAERMREHFEAQSGF